MVIYGFFRLNTDDRRDLGISILEFRLLLMNYIYFELDFYNIFHLNFYNIFHLKLKYELTSSLDYSMSSESDYHSSSSPAR